MDDKYYEMWIITSDVEKIIKHSDYKNILIEEAKELKTDYSRYVIFDTITDDCVFDTDNL